MKILLTGGSGKLGTELQKLRKFDYVPTHEEMDVTDWRSVQEYLPPKQVGLIVNCAAYTDVAKAETDRLACYKLNALAIQTMQNNFGGDILNISSEYAAFPDLNHYSFTKRIGENYADKSLRLLFKPRPWPYEFTFDDVFTSGDYIDVIAKEVNKAIDLYEYLPRVTNIGTGRKSMYDLAKQTNPDIQSISSEIYTVHIARPKDSSMDCSEWERIKRERLSMPV